MPLPVVPDHYMVQCIFQRLDGDPVANVFTFRNDTPTGSPEAAASALRDLMDTFYGDGAVTAGGVGGYLSDRMFALRYVIYDLGDPAAGAMELPSLTYRTTGSTTGTCLPPDVALVISWRTGRRGPRYRGRTFLGPLRTIQNNSGQVNPPTRDQIIVHARKLIGAPATRAFHIVVLSRKYGTVEDVTGGDIDQEFDTQRRRGTVASARTTFVGP